MENKTGICPCCNRQVNTLAKRLMNTQYANPEDNYIYSCKECWEKSEDYWKERWEEYYNGCM